MKKETKNIALLIDSDNISAKQADWIINTVSDLGRISVRRIYGDFTSDNLKNWNEKTIRYALKPIQKFASRSGKNSTDVALIIDAMDLLHREKELDGYVIASSDGDFAALASRMRENGLYVWGLGEEEKATEQFKNACDEFLYIPSTKKKKGKNIISKKDIDLLSELYDNNESEDESVLLAQLASSVRNVRPELNPKNLGFRNWKALFLSLNNLYIVEVEKDGKTVKVKKRNNKK